ncbi:hypothetical protein SVXHr_2038 [Halorhabdus sp. SVX81]|uniref:hypothetical protein n=1 Tax=Halorhabdus sp. SVX81 TaxID=2978283 RepID=UPI0023DC5FE0|nr:hypothetical protein [Halorhabdus sp. SVX81]WEL18198.1 hypothetical protein SVXHr_2038 [Halorhabdus sp. SVX81]
MSDWSADESDGGWSDDRPETERGTHETDVEWAADESGMETEQQRLPGPQVLPTFRWAVSVLRESPFLVTVALIASSVELFVLQSPVELFAVGGDLLRWGVLFLDLALVAALAAVVAEDAFEDRHRTVVAQLGAFLESLPAVLLTAILFGFPILFAISFLISAGYLPYKLVIAVLGGYLMAELLVVVSAVVLDRSMRQGRTAFAESRLAALGLLLVLTLGHAPIVLLSPTLAEPVLAMVLAVWAGVVTAVVSLAYTRIYVIHAPKKQRQSGSQGGGIPREMEGRHGMWQQQSDGA